MTKPPELFLVGDLVKPLCHDQECDIKENPDHYVSIHLSEYVKETITQAVNYLAPDVKHSPLAEAIYARLSAILEADRTGD